MPMSSPPAKIYKGFITTVILWDVVLFILSTDRRIWESYDQVFYVSEAVVSCMFLLEYLLRLYTCTERAKYKEMGPIRGRLRYMVTFAALIDFLATFPFFVELVFPVDLPTFTYLRVFRLARILRTSGFVRAVDAVYRVLYYNRDILYVALWVGALFIMGTSVLLYVFRPRNIEDYKNNVGDLDHFRSLPATLYMATLMLTGQGGPNEEALPWYTSVVVLITAVVSVAMFAIPASMLTWGFEAGACVFSNL